MLHKGPLERTSCVSKKWVLGAAMDDEGEERRIEASFYPKTGKKKVNIAIQGI